MSTVDSPENYQPAPDAAPQAPTEADKDANAAVNEELAKSDDATSYVEDRKEQEAAERGEDPPPRRTSRYERLKRARDQYRAEAEGLRARLGDTESAEEREAYSETQAPSDSGASGVDTAETIRLENSLQSAQHMHGEAFDRAYQSFLEHAYATRDQAAYQRIMQSDDPGAELIQWHNEQGNPSPEGWGQQELQQQQEQQRQHEVNMVQATYNVRLEAVAAEVPDFKETIESVRGLVEIPPLFGEMVMRSPWGPRIVYSLAKQAWQPEGGILWELEKLAGDPISQARLFQAIESEFQMYDRLQQGGQQGNRATQAPPPMRPVTGGSATPRRDLESLAGRDDVSDYVAARRRQMRA